MPARPNNPPEVATREGGSRVSPSHTVADQYVPQLDLSRVAPAHGLGDRLGSKFRSPTRTIRNKSTGPLLQVNHTLCTDTAGDRKERRGSDSSVSSEVSETSEGHNEIAGNTFETFLGKDVRITKLNDSTPKNETPEEYVSDLEHDDTT